MENFVHIFVSSTISIGDKVKIGNKVVLIKEIVKIDFDLRKMWFIGVDVKLEKFCTQNYN